VTIIAIRRRCAKWLLCHRSFFDPDSGHIDEARITAACELALLVWLRVRMLPRPCTSRYWPLLACLRRWSESATVKEIFSSAPASAWSGQLALSISIGTASQDLCQKTITLFPEVNVYRQLEWSWWCMQIANRPWRKSVRDLGSVLLTRQLQKFCECYLTRAAYELMHIIFFATDFGRLPLQISRGDRRILTELLERILREHLLNHDLTAEVLLARSCLQMHELSDTLAILTRLATAQQPSGAFASGSAETLYHPCIALLLPGRTLFQ
jgi:hypothetical protein